MTFQTQGSGIFQKQLRLRRVVRVMTGNATLLRGRVSVFARQNLLEVVVTAQAQFVDRTFHRAGILGIVALVADAAIAGIVGRMIGDNLVAGRNGRNPDVADLDHRVGDCNRCGRRGAMLLLGCLNRSLSAAEQGGEQQKARNTKEPDGGIEISANRRR